MDSEGLDKMMKESERYRLPALDRYVVGMKITA